MSISGGSFPVSGIDVGKSHTDVQVPIHREAPIHERLYRQHRLCVTWILYYDWHESVLQDGEPPTRQGGGWATCTWYSAGDC